MKKRFLAVLLSLTMALSLVTTSALAAETATVTIETAAEAVEAGDEVTLAVSIANNPGFTNFEWNIVYDNARLELKAINTKDGKIPYIDGLVVTNTNKNDSGSGYITCTCTEAATMNDTLFTLTFQVKADAEAGEASVSITEDLVKNLDADVSVDYVVGGVTVKADTTGGSTTGGSTTGGSTTGGSTTGGSTTGGSTTGGSTTGGSTTGGSTTGGSTTGGSTTGGSTTGGSTTGGSTTGCSTTGGSTTGGSTTGGSTTGGSTTGVTVITVGDIAYTVSGNVVTTTHTAPCKLGYLTLDGSYTAITATENADGSHSFTAPDGVTEVLLVVKGDSNGDGSLSNADYARLNAALLEKTSLTKITAFAADVNGDGSLSNADYARLNAVLLEKTTMAW